MKGIVISLTNRSALAQQWHVDTEDLDDLLPIGYVLLAEFGNEWNEGVMTQATFDEFFLKGAALENDYFVVTRKPFI